jgi:hypothetical protein
MRHLASIPTLFHCKIEPDHTRNRGSKYRRNHGCGNHHGLNRSITIPNIKSKLTTNMITLMFWDVKGTLLNSISKGQKTATSTAISLTNSPIISAVVRFPFIVLELLYNLFNIVKWRSVLTTRSAKLG